jgi:hypothetical protein
MLSLIRVMPEQVIAIAVPEKRHSPGSSAQKNSVTFVVCFRRRIDAEL